jgi:DNA ligase (NAD+)
MGRKIIEILEKASAAYYQGQPIMTDAEYDAAVDELRATNPEHPFLKRVGAPVPGTNKARHEIAMGSLDNAKNVEEFLAWLPKDWGIFIHLSHKMDGLSVELLYQEGRLVQAITRGDGHEGEDITKNIIRSGNIPLTVDPRMKSVRGEIVIHKSDWEMYFRGEANPRNSAAGTARRQDGTNAQYLQFYAFDAIGEYLPDTENALIEKLEKYFNVPKWYASKVHSELVKWYKKELDGRDVLEYEIDGIVAKRNDKLSAEDMGFVNNRPKGQIAIKFPPRGGETVLRDVVWQVGSTGAVVPVAVVDPVGVGGTIIRRASLCNIDEIRRLDIAIGDIVEIIRAGDVIPKITKRIYKSVVRELIKIPDKCPECGETIERNRINNVHIYCNNETCTGKTTGRIMNWIKKRNILNLGIGIVEAANIKSISELYRMNIDEWADVQVGNGQLGWLRARKIMESLEKSIRVTLGDFLGSIGIKGIGRTLSRRLVQNLSLQNLDDIFNLDFNTVSKQNGFATRRAIDFIYWLEDHEDEVRDLASLISFQSSTTSKRGLLGETVAFTGKSPRPRKEMSRLAEEAGAIISNGVTASTTILVIADPNSTSSKAQKARGSGVKLISPEDFLKIVE